DAARVRTQARARLREGLRYSQRLRRTLLEETDDDREWIANPRQKNTTFPLVMDAQTFATWGEVLVELERIVDGNALLGGSVPTRGGGGISLTFGLCPPDQGLDVKALFDRPLQNPQQPGAFKTYCAVPTKARPLSKLESIAAASIARHPGGGEASGE